MTLQDFIEQNEQSVKTCDIYTAFKLSTASQLIDFAHLCLVDASNSSFWREPFQK